MNTLSDSDHLESSLMQNLDLDDDLWQKALASQTTNPLTIPRSPPPQPLSIPAYHFPSLNRISHQRQLSDPSFLPNEKRPPSHQRVLSSMSLNDEEFIQSEIIARPDLQITPKSPRFSVYLPKQNYDQSKNNRVDNSYDNSASNINTLIENQYTDNRLINAGIFRRQSSLEDDDINDGIDFDENEGSDYEDEQNNKMKDFIIGGNNGGMKWSTRFIQPSSNKSSPMKSSKGHGKNSSISSMFSNLKSGLKKHSKNIDSEL